MQTLLWIFAAAIAGAAWLSCAYVAFSRTTLRTVVRLGDESAESRQSIWTWRFPGWRNWALVGLVIIPMLSVIGPFMLPSSGGEERAVAEAKVAPAPTIAPTLDVATEMPTETSSPVPVVALPTDTPSPTPSSTPTTAPPTETPTRTPTMPNSTETTAWTPSPLPTTQMPTATAIEPSATPTWTPTLTPTLAPTTAVVSTETPTWTPMASATPLELAEPLLGRTYKNPIVFHWNGTLAWAQSYHVSVYHILSGQTIQSGPLSVPEWTVDLPGERFGEWRWRVSILAYGQVVTTSAEWMFWFDPFPRTATRTPTPTPTRTPLPPKLP